MNIVWTGCPSGEEQKPKRDKKADDQHTQARAHRRTAKVSVLGTSENVDIQAIMDKVQIL